MNKFSKAARNIMLATAIILTSCNDIVTYNDGYDDGMTSNGAPVITGVYSPEDREFTTPLTEAQFGEYIMVTGENLSNVTQIRMNDVEVDMTDVYATSSTAWFAVPSAAPTEFSNKIYYQTKLGETAYDFTVIVPDVSVIGLYNEMAPAGSTVKVEGSFFQLHGFGSKETSQVTMNGTPLEVSDVSDNGLTLKIPENAQPNSLITFEWQGANGTQTVSTPYARKEDLIYEDWSAAGNWGDASYLVTNPEDTDPPALCGPYFRVHKSFGAWAFSWVLGSGFNLAPEVVENPENYLMKFEVCSGMDSPFQDTGANDGNGYTIVLGDDANKYEWNPSSVQSFNTFGEWCTVRLEVADLIAASKPSAGWVTFKMSFQPVAAIDADHCFANFRIERKINE